MKIVLASHNAKKLAELRRIATRAGGSVEVLGLDDLPAYPEPEETEWTFAGNALLKARACAAITGLAALADDSGIEVDALNNMPGVRSARWAGPGASDADNLELLLRQLADVPAGRRAGRFVCAMALVTPAGREFVARGEMPGRLVHAPAGGSGFGYDPIFVADGQDLTNAQLSAEQKDAISHRGKALRAIWPRVAELAAPAARGAGE